MVANVNIVEGEQLTPFDFIPDLDEGDGEIDRDAITDRTRRFMESQMKRQNEQSGEDGSC